MPEDTKLEVAIAAFWLLLYSRWYDADRAGHPRRAAVWGWCADRIVGWVR